MSSRRLVILAFFLLVSVIIFLTRDLPPVKFLASQIQFVFSTPTSLIYGLKTNLTSDSQNQKLRNENQELTRKFVDYERMKRDNEALRSQFETPATQKFDLVPAKVLGFLGNYNNPSALIINVGFKNNVRSGMAVILGTNLVGRIVNVSSDYSKVLLPDDPAFSIVARTATNNSSGIITGQQDFMILDRVLVKDKISQDELVLTRGEGESDQALIPADLVIGKITSIFKNESMPYQTAKVSSMLETNKIETVFVVLGF